MAQLQDEEVGDGTTSVVIVAAELLKNADELVKQKIHPTSIMAGYRLACKEAVKYIQVRKSSFCEFSLPSPFDKFFHFRELLSVQFGHFRKSMVSKKMLSKISFAHFLSCRHLTNFSFLRDTFGSDILEDYGGILIGL